MAKAPKTQQKKGKPASKRGGKRPGSGRKPKSWHENRAALIAEFESRNAEFLPRAFENLVRLANGGYERVEEEQTRDELTGELTTTKRKTSIADADRAANQYLIDRLLGRPKQAVEMSGPDGGAIPVEFRAAMMKFYGEAAEAKS